MRESIRKDKLRPKEDRRELELTGDALQVKGAFANVDDLKIPSGALPTSWKPPGAFANVDDLKKFFRSSTLLAKAPGGMLCK